MSIFSRKPKILPSLPDELIKKYFEDNPEQKYICNVPYTTLYITASGNVGGCGWSFECSVCLYGHYPSQSFKEILNSQRRKMHQKRIKNNNLTEDCLYCENRFLFQNTYDMPNLYSLYLTNHNYLKIVFELSNLCNLSCITCNRYFHYNNQTINVDKLLLDLKPYIKKIMFTDFCGGGEPFFIKDYYKIWDFIAKENPNCTIYIQTNGTIYNETIEKLIKNYNVRISVSIDSLQKEKFEYIRKGANFENVMSNFYKFNEVMQRKNGYIDLSITPSIFNLHEIPQLIDFANQNNAKVFLSPLAYPHEFSFENLSLEELEKIIEEYENYYSIIKNTSEVIDYNKKVLKGLITDILMSKNKEFFLKKNKELLNKEDFLIFIEKEMRNHEYYPLMLEIYHDLPETFYINSQKLNIIKSEDFYKIIISSHNYDSNIYSGNKKEYIMDYLLYI